MKKKYIYDEFYKQEILLVVGCPYKTLKYLGRTFTLSEESLNGIKETISMNHAGGLVTLEAETGEFYRVLWLRSFDESTEDLSILAHEVFHLVSCVLSIRGIHHIVETEEPYAYAMGFYYKKILEALLKMGGTNAKKE